MAQSNKEQLFPLNLGIQTYRPEIVTDGFSLANLENFRVLFNRLYPVRSHELYYAFPGETVRGMAYVFNVGAQSLEFFVLTKDKAYVLSVDNTLEPTFVQVPHTDTGTYPWLRDHKVAWVSWDDDEVGKVYFTKQGTPIQRLTGAALDTVPATWLDEAGDPALLAGKYAAVIQSRVVIAHVSTSDSFYPRRVQWSDLYNPEEWDIRPDTEADFFDLETGNLEITGLFNHRGYMTLFTRRAIWRASYIGPPQVFRFEPVYADFGNIYHHAAVSVKDVVYFIGSDNFYAMEGFSPRPIGNEIWPEWLESNDTKIDQPVYGWSNEEKREIFWKFFRKGRLDVPPGPIVLNNLDGIEGNNQTLEYDGRVNGEYSWKCVSIDCTDEHVFAWDNSQAVWKLYVNGVTNGDYIKTRDPFGSPQWYDINDDPISPVSDPIAKGAWDYRSEPHECLVCYNYQENQWSFRETQNITEFYRNEYPIQATQVWSRFDEAWSENGVYTPPVYWKDAPWGDGALPHGTATIPAGTRIWNGDWQVSSFPVTQLVGKAEGLYINEAGEWEDNNGYPAYAEFRSHELLFGSLMGTKDIEQVKLTYITIGNPVVTVEIGTRNNYSEVLRWSDPIEAQNVDAIEREFRFDTRFPGKLFTVRMRAYNTETDYLHELVGGSLYTSGCKSKGSEE